MFLESQQRRLRSLAHGSEEEEIGLPNTVEIIALPTKFAKLARLIFMQLIIELKNSELWELERSSTTHDLYMDQT